MKVPVFILVMLLGSYTQAQQTDSTGMPGDNLDLHAVLDQFKKSDNLEDFEKSLNNPDNKINNLDLNKDGQTDYIKVVDNADSNAHAIVLQVPINEKESQDVAVIEVEQQGVENARIQIVGDEEVYGEDYVVEPYENYVGKEEWDAQHQTKNTETTRSHVVVNVYTWPCVTYIYRPVYRPWRSPWYWGYYPPWWRPWRPYHWHVYHGYMSHYHGPGYYYHRGHVHHMRAARQVYVQHRTTSPTYQRSAPVVKNKPQRVQPRERDRNKNIPNDRSRQNMHKQKQPRDKVRTQQPNKQPRQRHNGGQPRQKPSGHRK